jgi:cation transport regulator ChaB
MKPETRDGTGNKATAHDAAWAQARSHSASGAVKAIQLGWGWIPDVP